MVEQIEMLAELDARDEALDALDSAHRWWVVLAVAEIKRLAMRRTELTAQDIWDRLAKKPTEPRAMGAAFREAARAGIVRRTGDYVPRGSHGRPIQVWRSMVYSNGGEQ